MTLLIEHKVQEDMLPPRPIFRRGLVPSASVPHAPDEPRCCKCGVHVSRDEIEAHREREYGRTMDFCDGCHSMIQTWRRASGLTRTGRALCTS